MAGIKLRYGFTSLELFQDGGNWAVEGKIIPSKKKKTKAKPTKFTQFKVGDKDHMKTGRDWDADPLKITQKINQFSFSATGTVNGVVVTKTLTEKTFGVEWKYYSYTI